MRAVWEIGSTASVVKTSYVGEGVNSSFGFFLGLQKAIFKNPKMNWVSRLGFMYSPACQNPETCNTWWYGSNLSAESYLAWEKDFGSRGKVDYGIGYRMFYGSSLSSKSTFIQEGVLMRTTYLYSPEVVHGPSLILGYSNERISKSLRLSYSLSTSVLDRFATGVHSFGLVYRLEQPLFRKR